MTEKTVTNDAQARKERFEFILTINDNIICQRYFRINGFRNESLSSLELLDCIDRCVDMINEDLKIKTHLYAINAAPQVFENSDEMKNCLAKGYGYRLKVPSYIALRETEEVFVWDGEKAEPYGKFFNGVSDFISPKDNDGEWVLKFSFCDNGREVISRIWDANDYPRFVRTNIDLSNSRNRYEGGDTFMPLEAALVKIFNASQEDIIPKIIAEICKTCCNYKDGFTTTDTYGSTTYNFNIENHNFKLMKSIEKAYRKKFKK